jgi:hypothetical protein
MCTKLRPQNELSANSLLMHYYQLHYPICQHFTCSLHRVSVLSLSLPRPLRSLIIDPRLKRTLAILFPVRSQKARQEPSNFLLVNLVLGVLASRNILSQGCATSEDAQVCQRTSSSPVPPAASAVRGPRIQRDPDGLLGGEVGVTRERPETGCVEAAVELRARVAWLRFGGALVGGFGVVEVPLLLVGDELDGD